MDNHDKALNQRLQALMQWLFCEPNPIAINTALMMTGAVEPVFRLPYQALTLTQRQQGMEVLSQFEQNELIGERLALMQDSDFSYCV